jgi:hypothetical protein
MTTEIEHWPPPERSFRSNQSADDPTGIEDSKAFICAMTAD